MLSNSFISILASFLPFKRLVGIFSDLGPKNEVVGENDLPIVPLIFKVGSFQLIKIEFFFTKSSTGSESKILNLWS